MDTHQLTHGCFRHRSNMRPNISRLHLMQSKCDVGRSQMHSTSPVGMSSTTMKSTVSDAAPLIVHASRNICLKRWQIKQPNAQYFLEIFVEIVLAGTAGPKQIFRGNFTWFVEVRSPLATELRECLLRLNYAHQNLDSKSTNDLLAGV